MKVNQKLLLLELIRGCAAIIVLLSHLIPKLGVAPELRNLFNYGTEAVAVFFVLSGYVMSYSFQRKPRTRRSFLVSRLIRIYPAYFLALTMSLILLWDDEVYSSHILLNYLMLGSLDQGVVRLPINNLALWSITYEMMFYYLFSLCIAKGEISLLRAGIWTSVAFIFLILMRGVEIDFDLIRLVSQSLAFSLTWLIGFWAHQMESSFMKIPFTAKAGLFFSLFAISRLPFTEIISPTKFALIALVSAPVFCGGWDSENKSNSKVKTLLWFCFLVGINSVIFIYSEATRTNSIVYFALPLVVMMFFAVTGINHRRSQEILRNFEKLILHMGRISFVLYVMHMPIMHVFLGLFGETLFSLIGMSVTIFALIILVEYIVQPRISLLLRQKFSRKVQ